MTTIVEFAYSRDEDLVPQFVELHIACVLSDHMLARFLPPFTEEKKTRMQDFYHDRLAAVEAGTQHLFMCMDGDGEQREVTGLVFLNKPWSETGPFRAGVELLMVSPNHRRKGIAKRLMTALEAKALGLKRNLLLLETEEGSDAEFVYPRLGYIEVGRIPDYGYSPKDCRLTVGVSFYKRIGEIDSQPYKAL